MVDKGPGDIKYGGKSKNIPDGPEGYPNPYKREFNAYDGVEDDYSADSGEGDGKQNQSVSDNIGDDGKG